MWHVASYSCAISTRVDLMCVVTPVVLSCHLFCCTCSVVPMDSRYEIVHSAATSYVTNTVASTVQYAYVRWSQLQACTTSEEKTQLSVKIERMEFNSDGVINTNSMLQYSKFMKHYTDDLILFTIHHPFKSMRSWIAAAEMIRQHGEHIDKSALLILLQEKLLAQKHPNMQQIWQDAINQLAPENAPKTTGTSNTHTHTHAHTPTQHTKHNTHT